MKTNRGNSSHIWSQNSRSLRPSNHEHMHEDVYTVMLDQLSFIILITPKALTMTTF